ncbi:hypothetical protein [Kribbella qitaiheensis]|uniref:hypothetical protein n=1 Tax=Kribbella qitaiheensis TaxID=1544730 RepID=UPI001FE936A1|nr:hypothetical protein [Kribbella qitaiheensis]
MSNVYLDVSKLKLKYLHPDYEGLRETVQKALEAKPSDAPATPKTPATPGKSTTPGKSVTPPPTENLNDACAYHPTGDQADS